MTARLVANWSIEQANDVGLRWVADGKAEKVVLRRCSVWQHHSCIWRYLTGGRNHHIKNLPWTITRPFSDKPCSKFGEEILLVVPRSGVPKNGKNLVFGAATRIELVTSCRSRRCPRETNLSPKQARYHYAKRPP